jgi:hypothetical protein
VAVDVLEMTEAADPRCDWGSAEVGVIGCDVAGERLRKCRTKMNGDSLLLRVSVTFGSCLHMQACRE